MVNFKPEHDNENVDGHAINDVGCKSGIEDLVGALVSLGIDRNVILNKPDELLKQVESFRRTKELWTKTKDLLGKKNIETLKKAIKQNKKGTFEIYEEKKSLDNVEFEEMQWKLDSMIGKNGVEFIPLNNDLVKQRKVYLVKETYLDEIKNKNEELSEKLKYFKENAVKVWSVGLNEQQFDFDKILSRVGPSEKHHDKIYEVTINDKHLSTPEQVTSLKKLIQALKTKFKKLIRVRIISVDFKSLEEVRGHFNNRLEIIYISRDKKEIHDRFLRFNDMNYFIIFGRGLDMWKAGTYRPLPGNNMIGISTKSDLEIVKFVGISKTFR